MVSKVKNVIKWFRPVWSGAKQGILIFGTYDGTEVGDGTEAGNGTEAEFGCFLDAAVSLVGKVGCLWIEPELCSPDEFEILGN